MLLDEVAKLIADNTTTRIIGSTLFKGFEHNLAPDTSTFVHETQGREPQRVFGSSKPAWETPRIQIIDRSTDYQIARNSAELIYRIFLGQINVQLAPTTGSTGTNYLALTPLQSPFYLGQDDNQRHEFSTNYDVMKELST